MWEWIAGEDAPGDDGQELCVLKTRHTDEGVTALLVYKCGCGQQPCQWLLPAHDFEDPENVPVLYWDRVTDGSIALEWLPPIFAIILELAAVSASGK